MTNGKSTATVFVWVLCVLSFNARAYGMDESPESVRECVLSFVKLSQSVVRSWHVSGVERKSESKLSKKSESEMSVRSMSDGVFFLAESKIVKDKKTKTTIILANDDYSGTISRFEEQPWSIENLHLRSAVSFRSNIHDAFVPLAQFGQGPYELLFAAVSSGEFNERSREHKSIVYDVKMKPTTESEPGKPVFAQVQVELERVDGNLFLKRISYDSSATVGTLDLVMHTELVFSEWKLAGDYYLPSRIVRDYKQLDPVKKGVVLVHSFEEKTYDYSRIQEPVAKNECYLSHYGLPEPLGVQRWSWLWLLLAVMAGFAGIIGFRMLRTA